MNTKTINWTSKQQLVFINPKYRNNMKSKTALIAVSTFNDNWKKCNSAKKMQLIKDK